MKEFKGNLSWKESGYLETHLSATNPFHERLYVYWKTDSMIGIVFKEKASNNKPWLHQKDDVMTL